MAKFAIPVTAETLPLCEFIHKGPIPHVHEDSYFFINTDPDLTYKMGVTPAENVRINPPVVVFKVEE